MENGMIDRYTKELYRHCPEDARIIFCQFRGDPYEDRRGKWKPRILRRDADNVDEMANVYITTSFCKQNAKGEWRRRKDNFAAGAFILLDDIPEHSPIYSILSPTVVVRTSPGNYQYHYFLSEPEYDQAKFDGLMLGLIEQREDLDFDRAGSIGVTRVGRPPIGVNGKEKYKGDDGLPFFVDEVESDYGRRYTVGEIAAAFGVEIVDRNLGWVETEKTAYDVRVRAFRDFYNMMNAAGMLKAHQPDQSGWLDIRCPFIDGLVDESGEVIFEPHSGRADTGSAIRIPAPENFWYGAFRCHHKHAGRGEDRQQLCWSDLTDYLADAATEILEGINRKAPDSLGDIYD
jgi:hypothetical protein